MQRFIVIEKFAQIMKAQIAQRNGVTFQINFLFVE